MEVRTVLHKIGKVAVYIQISIIALYFVALWLTGVSMMFELGWFYQIWDTVLLIVKFGALTIPFTLLIIISPNGGESE